MAGMAVGQHNLPTGSCRQVRISIDVETRSCLKKSSFPEPLRDIEQRLSVPKTSSDCDAAWNRLAGGMIGLFRFALCVLALPFRSKLRLEAENAALRHQLIVLRRRPRGRVRLTNLDRWFFIQLYRWFPAILKVLTSIRPETVVRWHRAGFRCYWRWKSRPQGGRPPVE